MGIKEIAESLGKAKGHGSQWQALCPAHEDSEASLSLTERNGKILVKCHAGCPQKAVLDALRERGLWSHEKKAPPPPKGIPDRWPTDSMLKKSGVAPTEKNQKKLISQHPYRNAEGVTLGVVARYENSDGKEVIPFFDRFTNGGWKAGKVPKIRPLYNLDHLAKRSTERVFIVEGEKCADAAMRNGLLATTWIGGAQGVTKCAIESLSGREIVLWPDKDDAGKKAMAQMLLRLRALPTKPTKIWFVKVDDIPQLEEHEDCVEYFDKDLPITALPVAEDKVSSTEAFLMTLTDTANAERLVKAHGDVLKYAEGKGWFYWNGQYWTPDQAGYVTGLAISTARKIVDEAKKAANPEEAKALIEWAQRSLNRRPLEAMVALAQSGAGIPVEMKFFDADDWSLNVRNGMVDLKTGQLLAHDKKALHTKIIDLDYVPGAQCPMWTAFLHRIMEGDETMIEYLQRAIGYSLTGSTQEQKLFMCWGTGSNGKSVFMETVKAILGEYAMTCATDVLLQSQTNTGANNYIARLRGARMVLANEMKLGDRLNESLVKQMTGSDTVVARFLHKEFFEFTPQFKIWLRTNHRPEVSGVDEGIWRRLHTIPFQASIPDEEKDRNLTTKLRMEYSGILSWMVQGCVKWFQDGLRTTPQVSKANAIYKADMDVMQDYLDERCVVRETETVSAKELYKDYRGWAKETGERALSQKKFGIGLRERGFMRVHKETGRFYLGLSLKFGSDGYHDGYDDHEGPNI